MIAFVNGRFLPEAEAMLPVSDRSFLYGDGLFETVRVHGSRLFLWPEHAERLRQGASWLAIPLPLNENQLRSAALELARSNDLRDGSLRLHISRGSGPRGYSPRGADRPSVVITAHPGVPLEVHPARPWRLITSSFRLPSADPLSAFKTACKLLQVCAKAEADRLGADDALLLNDRGEAAESTCASLFWFVPEGVATPGPDSGALPGTTQAFVRRLAHRLGWACQAGIANQDSLRRTSGVFLTFSGLGIVSVSHLDQLAISQDPRLHILTSAFMDSLPSELSD